MLNSLSCPDRETEAIQSLWNSRSNCYILNETNVLQRLFVRKSYDDLLNLSSGYSAESITVSIYFLAKGWRNISMILFSTTAMAKTQHVRQGIRLRSPAFSQCVLIAVRNRADWNLMTYCVLSFFDGLRTCVSSNSEFHSLISCSSCCSASRLLYTVAWERYLSSHLEPTSDSVQLWHIFHVTNFKGGARANAGWVEVARTGIGALFLLHCF